MRWHVAKEEQFPAVLDFLQRYEWGCVALTAQLMSHGEPAYPSRLRKRIHIDNDTNDTVRAAVLQTNGGFVFPVFADELGTSPALTDRFYAKLKRGALFINTLMGRAGHVAAVERVIPKVPTHQVSYFLMVLEGEPQERPIDPELEAQLQVCEATPRDAGKLFPLQEGYEREEVLLDGRSFQPQAAWQALKSGLRDHIVLYATLRGRPVAKAATNARGIHYDQIGGVYTLPQYRGRGIARELMHHLLRRIRAADRGATLFVKKHNAAAITLYRHLGFRIRDDFRITYYLA